MRFSIVVGCCLFLIPACRPVKEMYQSENGTIKIIRETVRDTTVILSQDSSMLRALLECDSSGQVILKELLAYRSGKRVGLPEIVIHNNTLTAKAWVDSAAIYLRWHDRYEQDSVVSLREEIRTVEVNRLKGWQKILIWIGVIAVVRVFYRLYRTFQFKM